MMKTRLPHRLAARLCASRAAAALPRDVDRSTGLCADGLVRIAWASDQKGLGAFAVSPLQPEQVVGLYAGEVLTLGGLLRRYGAGGVDTPGEYEAANWQAAWAADRAARGVGVTGEYVFNAGECPHSGRALLLDAEDPACSNWTRYLNHSARRPNLLVEREVRASAEASGVGSATPPSAGTPLVRFVVARPVAAGDELLFDYGEGYEIDVLGFEE